MMAGIHDGFGARIRDCCVILARIHAWIPVLNGFLIFFGARQIELKVREGGISRVLHLHALMHESQHALHGIPSRR